MKRRIFLKGIFPTIFAPKLIIPMWNKIYKINTNLSYGDFNAVIFPLIKQVYPAMSVSELVNVQPMHGPTGKIIYLDLIVNRPSATNTIFSSII